ncbi:MAG: ATP-dependent DNA ligase, partial [Candidatus Eremiobacteraeota bacterium]|nr:ATP-dependent DNA ligase [Candidatus Eremiobacteraeota bacterium]
MKRFEPAEARHLDELPKGSGWQYEPKWDGFRCIAFKRGAVVELRSKSDKRLDRYFPEVVAAVRALPLRTCILDGELVIRTGARSDFDELLQRIHPASSRVNALAAQHPANYIVFDILADAPRSALAARSLSERRARLDAVAKKYFGPKGLI